ncbi:LacI family DNA-binding transcriptional regulator [Yoonia sediminilitoris]|uniref:LacI family transcriptional regulator n=1 Tax=Yoonia sediminilitoris TaxID=1286148 RepID=A0A2T6KHL6_9RHOB|nr:LacI family DNA-binding transcriptional regulator [Yoonia sediminilitoris]PUB14951.1 LacI family transcriptional regulator [Yoonia sediminilitoris]RCW95667.1 LacI family transcriptional regulator [Yoonia sediminilitoris]
MNVKRPTPTLHDVATRSGVSTATVSRCLNFPDQVAERTRKKVMKAIDDLGYSPNFGAKVMAARRTNTIGAIIPTMENAVFARGLQAFQEELRDHGFTMLVASTSYRPDVEEEQVRALVARGADALLLIGHDRDPAVYEFLEAQGVPALVTWAFDAGSQRPSVGFDNKAAMHEMASEVIALGHRNLAFISAKTRMNDRATARYHGIKSAMTEAGLNPDDLLFAETTYSIEHGAEEFEKVMQAPVRPTAVFCGNDVLAVGALRRARELGIKVPQEVSILGFDDIELAQIAYPALTTVHVPHREMGRRAAMALVGLLKDGTPIKPVKLHAAPIFRDTLAAAAGS